MCVVLDLGVACVRVCVRRVEMVGEEEGGDARRRSERGGGGGWRVCEEAGSGRRVDLPGVCLYLRVR